MVVLINDIKVQDEKIVIITEDQILKALGLSKKRYKLLEAYDDFPKARVIIKVGSVNHYNDYDYNKEVDKRTTKINLNEAKTLDAYIITADDLKGVTVTLDDMSE